MTPPAPAPEIAPGQAKVRRYSRLFVWTMLAAWLLTFAPMVYQLGMLPLALVATVWGVLAFWSTFGLPEMKTMRIMLAIGGVMAGFFALMGIGWLVIAPEVVELDSCTRASLTPQGELECQQAFDESVLDRFGIEFP